MTGGQHGLKFKVYRNDTPNSGSIKPGGLKKPFIALGLIIVLLGAFLFIVNILSEYIWMDNLGFKDVFLTIFSTRILLFGIGFAIYALALFLTLLGIYRVYTQRFNMESLPRLFRVRKLFLWFGLAVSFLFGLIGSGVIQGIGWERFLTYFHQEPFNVNDPVFGEDVSFYVYTLPFWNFVLNMLTGLLLILIIIQGLAFSVFRLYWHERRAKIQLAVTGIFFGLVLAANHFLSRYDTLLTDQVNAFQRGVVFGAGYTDHVVNIPLAYVMAVVSIAAVLLGLTGIFRQKMRFLLAAPILYFGIFIAGQGVSFIVQNFLVVPNEFVREEPYLPHNMAYTRQAYGLEEITEIDHPGNLSLSRDMVEQNKLTIENVRVNDARPLIDAYNQLQTFRTYYQFNDVDVDRYVIDGEYRQVFIGPRELNTEDLPEQAQTWVNQKLRYTHGYGVAMSHVNRVTSQGQPEYMLKDLPATGELELTRPQIYFGEQDYHTVVVNTDIDEFDYPAGETNEYHRFSAEAGIPMTLFNRFVYSLEELSPRLLISGQIDADSRLLRKRNVLERLESIAPFLFYDDDPYIVVRDDGTLVWIVDAYTGTSQYPYSESIGQGMNMNYIKNPLKAVVDAYTGEVSFYVVDPDDPLFQTYQNIFPTLFTTDIPEDIRSHFRYPLQLFTYQAMMYRTYHMTDLEVFYNWEDYWQFPTENYYDSDVTMEPYYITMKLAEEEQEEFILMLPFTPNNRQNMIGWMAARNDGEHYGELLVHRFPKQRTIYGPQQIENRINQDPYISQQLNLWAQGGSRVIRGNLLVIPIEDTLLYVEPIYIESDNETSLPEVKQMIVSYGDYIVMESNFENAMNRLLDLLDQGVPAEEAPGMDEMPILTAEELIEALTDLFDRYQEALSDGDWSEAGRVMEELESHLAEWKTQQGEDVEAVPDADDEGEAERAPETGEAERVPEAGEGEQAPEAE